MSISPLFGVTEHPLQTALKKEEIMGFITDEKTSGRGVGFRLCMIQELITCHHDSGSISQLL